MEKTIIMNFKDVLDDTLNEEKTFNEYNFDEYIFYLKSGLDGQIPHIHYKNKNGNFGCFALEYCGYFNHSEGMKMMPSKSERKLIHLLSATNFWKEACLTWFGNNPNNPVRVLKDDKNNAINPYVGKSTMEFLEKPPARISENYIEIK